MFFKTAFFVKNIPDWERAIRISLAITFAIGSAALLPSPWDWIGALTCIGFGITGVVGFCPACALAGRRLARSHKRFDARW
ncbi:YgaP family membrane protein [Dyella japonica]|uniref:YgaP family membrane protein n=1 Tax=Dyella japonica TaxID=231455 RepID=UPI0009E190CC